MFSKVQEFDVALVSALLSHGVMYGVTPESVLIGLGEFKWSSSPSAEQASFYTPDFFLSSGGPTGAGSWACPTELLHVTRASVIDALESAMEMSDEVQPLEWQSPDFHAFRRRFLQVQREIRSGRWNKAVPVAFERSSGPLHTAHLAQMLLGSLRVPEPLIPYGLWTGQWGIIGASPELLVSVRERRAISACALAGTVERDEGNEALTRDPKQIHEHQLVVDYLRERLSSIGEPLVEQTTVQVLPRLLHLKTPIKVIARDEVGVFELSRLLHPTPALGVSPRHLGWEWLRDMDKEMPRGSFGAPFGVQFPDGAAESCIAIRGVQWRADQQGNLELLLGSGCGVVSESVLETEWAELAAKRDSVHHMLGV